MGDGNEHTGDEAPSRRERSETANGRRNPSDGKGSGGRGEDSLQGRDVYGAPSKYGFSAGRAVGAGPLNRHYLQLVARDVE